MSIKTWQERAHLEPDVRVEDLAYGVDLVMQIEIDELRAALAARDAEIERLNKGWGAANLLAFKHAQSIEAQRKVLEQALRALEYVKRPEGLLPNFDAAITAIQEQLV